MSTLQQQVPPRLTTADEIESSFRHSLEDVIEIAEKLAVCVSSVDELVDMMRLALTNDGQLRFLMGKVIPRPKR